MLSVVQHQYAGGIAVPSRRLLLTCAAGAFGLGWQNMLVIIVPLRALELGAPASIIGLIAGAGAAVPAVRSIPFGGIADRIGARAAYAWSALASAVLCVGFAITDSYWGMLGLQLVVGLARNSAWVVAQTYASHLAAAGGRARTMSAFAFTANVGTLVTSSSRCLRCYPPSPGSARVDAQRIAAEPGGNGVVDGALVERGVGPCRQARSRRPKGPVGVPSKNG